MSLNLQEFVNSRPIGNIHSGEKDENDRIHKYDYFNVHVDKSTPELAVEIFNEVYKNPKKLKIRFVSQNPMEVYLERYDGVRRKCFGNGKEATMLDDKGKKQVISCDAKICQYRQSGKCKYKARLCFLIYGLEQEGLWCYPIGSEKGIRNIVARIVRANRIGEDLTKNWYELYLNSEIAPVKGENYIPDIKKLEEIEDSSNNQNKDYNKNNEANNDKEKPKYYMMLTDFDTVMIQNKEYPKFKFIDTNKKNLEVILLEKSNQELLDLDRNSIIEPIKMEKKDNNIFLIDYKVVKAITNKIDENKKAV